MNDDLIEIEELYEDSTLSGEEKLWRAVIARALADAYQLNCQASDYDRSMALSWLRRGNAHFRLVCALAGYDPGYVLRIAEKIKAKKGIKNDKLRRRTRAPR